VVEHDERPVTRPAASEERRTAPVHVFASLGALLLALEFAALAAWLLGGTFHQIPSGPNVPPAWMRAALISGQVILNALMVFCFYRCLVRPWRRARQVSLDGLLCVVMFVSSFFDMLSVFGQHWFTYNAYLVNFGSVMSVIPGVTSLNARGVGQPFPILFMPALYVAGVVPLAMLGCAVMRRLRGRYGLSTGQLVGVCFVLMLVVDVIGEGMILIPLGFWSYEGAHLAVFPSHMWKYPFQEGIFAAAFFTTITCVRFFVNDVGETASERGLSSLSVRPDTRLVVRFLAVLALIQGGFLLAYHLPETLWGLNTTSWPRAAQNESYFTNRICGSYVDRACPGPRIPNAQQGAPYLNFDRVLVRP
jgi:hypothetical protein